MTSSYLAWMSHKFEKLCEARQNEIRAGSVLAYVTKRIAAITLPRALVVLRFLLNNPQNTLCIRPKLTTCSHPNSDTRSAETGEIFRLESSLYLHTLTNMANIQRSQGIYVLFAEGSVIRSTNGFMGVQK